MKMQFPVAPLAGAWIEIYCVWDEKGFNTVAPLAGAWIEILYRIQTSTTATVAPLAGAWIEMRRLRQSHPYRPCRSPRGSVD